MADMHEARCPECGATLEAGFVGNFSGMMWHDKEPKGWRRLLPFVLSAGSFVIGNVGSAPWVRCREARMCRDCGTLVVPT